ncbi:hypothetical protein Si099_02144 [Streptococcus infantarius subsp. infantarius]|nr:hypothetical protein [Streptococcus infantarius subsp. infantarius]
MISSFEMKIRPLKTGAFFRPAKSAFFGSHKSMKPILESANTIVMRMTVLPPPVPPPISKCGSEI